MIQDEPRTEKQMLAEVKEAKEGGFEYVSDSGDVARIKGAYVIHEEGEKIVFFYSTRDKEVNVMLLGHFFKFFKRVEK